MFGCGDLTDRDPTWEDHDVTTPKTSHRTATALVALFTLAGALIPLAVSSPAVAQSTHVGSGDSTMEVDYNLVPTDVVGSETVDWMVSGSLSGTVVLGGREVSGTFSVYGFGASVESWLTGGSGWIDHFEISGPGVTFEADAGEYSHSPLAHSRWTVPGTLSVCDGSGCDSGAAAFEIETFLSGTPPCWSGCTSFGQYQQFEGASPIPGGGAGGVPDPTQSAAFPPSYGPPRIVSGSGPDGTDWGMRWRFREGRSTACGPDETGDGWQCDPHTSHGFKFTGFADGWSSWDARSLNVNVEDGSTPVATAGVNCSSTSQLYCSYPNNTYNPNDATEWPPPESAWQEHQTLDSGCYSMQAEYWYGQGATVRSHESPFFGLDGRQWDQWCLNQVATNVTNTAPVVGIQAPIDGAELHRQGSPDHVESFAMRADDKEGHNGRGQMRLLLGGVVQETVRFSGLKHRSGMTAREAVTLPQANGTYTVEARAIDTSGTSTAASDWESITFDYIFNLAPEAPNLVAPANGATSGPTPSFVVEATDPELDAYTGLIQYWPAGDLSRIRTVESVPAASGSPAVAQAPEALEPGTYEWKAKAVDTHGEETDDFSAVRSFEVVDGPGVSNSPPGAPTLVAPVDGATLAHDATQEFTITATDPDGDDYVGEMSVVDSGGDETVFVTELADSGSPSSGSPLVELAPGEYTWSARAIDTNGGAGAFAAPASTFTIAEPPANAAPSASLVSPADGHAFGASDEQVFTVSATDPEGDAWSGEVFIDGDLACTTPEVASGSQASCSPLVPAGAGSHTWSARAVDEHGTAGGFTGSRSFTVVSGSAPATPAPVTPADGHTFATGETQRFGVNAEDPDGDPYHAEVTVWEGTTVVATFDTVEAPSGFDSYGIPDEALPPGDYTWSAVAVDVDGNRSSAFSPARSFTVNAPPAAPSLVGPANGYVFAPGEPQVFTINAVDPDGHDYQGTVTIEDPTGVPVARFETQRVASGADAAGSPLVRLPAGDYRWSATAADGHGGTSPPSSKRSFTVT